MDINIRTHNKEIKKGLYLIPTPIGNLEDITFRAVNILKKSDYILCEDTRVSKILFRKYEIKTKLIANHKFNETKNLPKIIELLKNGALVSLISDAGTPCVSDPGKILLNECIKKNIDVYSLPGPSSVTTAISASGFSEKFFFYGFFPEKKKDLKEDLSNLSKLNSCLVFFVSSKILPNGAFTLNQSGLGGEILSFLCIFSGCLIFFISFMTIFLIINVNF